jgi:hypothetical protein
MAAKRAQFRGGLKGERLVAGFFLKIKNSRLRTTFNYLRKRNAKG